ncbi:MAG: glycosyltransferase family 1 protein [Planctomycetes bacterium]|nr:glycosyltransferase family 1 protein [Planctomycetota bacterium]
MTTITVDAQREQILRLLEAGQTYRFLSAADPYLNGCPGDHPMRLMAVQEYLKLGLVAPAKELLQPASPSVDLPTEFGEIVEQVAALQAVSIPWSDRQKRFEGNLAALAARGIDVGPIRDAWKSKCDGFKLFRDRNGVEQVRMRDPSGRWRWIPFLGDHRAVADAQPLPQDIKTLMPGPYLFEGLDLGWFFRRLYEATRDTFLGYSCALFLVEPDPAAFAIPLHLHDWADLLADERVFVFVGESCTERLRQTLEGDPDLPWPRQAYTLSQFRPGCVPGPIEVVRDASAVRERQIQESFADLERRYASRDIHYWADRFEQALSGKGAPLRIFASVSTHTTFLQYSMRDAQRAFESLGHQCKVLMEKTPYTTIGRLTYHAAIREFDPDIFFVLDHLRPEFEGIIPTNLPVLSWDQDQLPQVFTRKNMARVARHDFIAGYSKHKFVVSGFDERQYLLARVPTCPEQFSGEPLTDDERDRYTCDVSYVSHASQTPQAFHQEERSRLKDARLTTLLDTMFAMAPGMLAKHRLMSGGVAGVILEDASRRCGMEVRDAELRDRLLWWYLCRLGDRMFRHEALEWVAAWARRTNRTLRIYGNGWDRHPSLAEFAAGPAQNGRELLCIYRASRINLQLMPAGFIHQRALDGLAGGGFFLTRVNPTELRGKTLRLLDTRIDELGLTSTRELMECADEKLQTLLKGYFEWLDRADPDAPDLFVGLRLAAELLQSDEVFPRFKEIVFDSADEFAVVAERFLADGSLRRDVADEMRQAVLEHFSYRPEMDRFLRAMAKYLKEASR